MGTNYYAIPKATEELKHSIIKAVEESNFTRVKSLMPHTIHIGKSSVGWRFLFNHNNWSYFEKNRKSVEWFLERCDLIDEYDRPVNHEEFWQMVDSKQGGKGEDLHGEEWDELNYSRYTDFS